jgi:hypothetical protein
MSEQNFDIERHYLRNIKTSILKDTNLRKIRANLRDLFRKWLFDLKSQLRKRYKEVNAALRKKHKEVIESLKKTHSPQLREEIKKIIGELDRIDRIYRKSILNDGDEDMIYNPFHEKWFTKENFDFFQIYFEVDLKKFMKEYSRPEIKGIQLEIVERYLWRDRDILFPLFHAWGTDFSEQEDGTFLNVPQDQELKDSIENNIKKLVFGKIPGERIDDSSIHTALDIIENKNS